MLSANLNRRHFLGASLAFTASLRGASPSRKFPKEPRKRLAVATYPFRSVVRVYGRKFDNSAARMSLAEFGGTIPDQFTVHGIEPWSAHFESTETEYIKDLRQSFDQAGLFVANIPCDVRVNLCGSDSERAQALETYGKWIDVALLLGSPSIRVHVPPVRNSTDLSCAVDGLKELAAAGARKRIVIDLENDAPATEPPDRVLKVIEAVNSPYLRACPDFCNSRQLGDERFNAAALTALFPHAYNISHVKDVEFHGGKTLTVDLSEIFQIARNANYRGYFSMEFSGRGDPYAETKRLIQASIQNLS
jgi:sugar phosphate isomerase/epimerase